MKRIDSYHRVCHQCAKTKWPKFWAFFVKHGWYPNTASELRNNAIDQKSHSKNWDGSPRVPKGKP